MDVKTLCLGLLSRREACGYELKKEFESLFKHFFTAGYGSIYPALADLSTEGLVSCREVPQDGKPDRKVYRITAQGRRAFESALHNMVPQHKMRSEFLAMVYFAESMAPERLHELLEDRLQKLREAVAHIEQIEADWDGKVPTGAQFVAGFGRAVTLAAADYIESHQHLLAPGPSRSTATESGRTKTVEEHA